MTAQRKPVLPLASVPTPANDVLPRATLSLPGVTQQIGFGRRRRTSPVAVEVKLPRAVNVMDVAEAAIFPRLFWGIYVSTEFSQDDPDNARIAKALQRDMQVYADLMTSTQWPDFRREMDTGAMSAMAVLTNWQIGASGGWNMLKVFAVIYLLMLWVDRHAAQAMFTTDFEAIASEVLDHIHEMHGDDFAKVAPSAHRMLPKVIRQLKACGLFCWLPDYRGIEE
ncbi:hypothetical protein [Thalassospira lohafexi]|uniref:Uncharacterized protein n=1 Tax=Thalassospira lohafexi TaxID=744227 RepID=A0A2N3L3U5_9PROT|nr:hypothetical protein [Thalassospira lohafexi]PKR57478.1 hypothetical protein COO92_16180 [Thalassospira lohafexi]